MNHTAVEDVPQAKSTFPPTNGTTYDNIPQKFVNTLFGDADTGWLNVFHLPSKHVTWFQLQDNIPPLDTTQNYYLSLGIRKEKTKGRGCLEDVIGIPGLWLDLDYESGEAHKAHDLPPDERACLDLIEHCPFKPTLIINTGNGLQVYWLFDEVWYFKDDAERVQAAQLCRGWQQWFQHKAKERGWHVDSTADLTRVFRIPGTKNIKREPFKSVTVLLDNGPHYEPSDFEDFASPDSIPSASAKPDDLTPESIDVLSIANLSDRIKLLILHADSLKEYNSRSEAEFDVIKALIDCGKNDNEIAGILLEKRYGISEMPREKGQKWVEGEIARVRQKHPAPDGATWTLGKDSGSYPLTDFGNAERFVAMHKHDVRFCHDFNKWIIWTGSHWQTDDNGTAVKLAKMTVRDMYRAAADIHDTNDRIALVKHAKSSESKRRIADMLSLAQSEHGIDIKPNDFDQHPWFLNCINGTLDLQTGRLRPHSRDDLLTRCLPIHFDPEAKAPIWEKFLNRVTNGDVELQRYLQCLAGVSLAGKVRERIFIVLYGKGKNGKTTFLEALETVFHPTTEGGYGTKLSARALMVQRYQSRATPEIAKLCGARFAYANEGQEGARLNEALIKEMTGGDTLTASFLYQNDFDFKPTFTLWFGTNHVPNITDTTDSIWDRVKLVPFTVRIPEDEIDLTLHEQLSQEAAGVLNWCIRGCLDWLEHGLHDPEIVIQATQDYRSNMDQMAQFIDERCTLADFANAKASLLYSGYTEWCKQSGEHPVTQRDFSGRMTERGLQRVRKKSGIFYHGIGLNPENEDEATEL